MRDVIPLGSVHVPRALCASCQLETVSMIEASPEMGLSSLDRSVMLSYHAVKDVFGRANRALVAS